MPKPSLRLLLILIASAWAFTGILAQPCDDPIDIGVTYSGPVCPGGAITLTFSFSGDDDDDLFNLSYTFAGQTFSLTGIANGAQTTHVVLGPTSVRIQAVVLLDDDDDECAVLPAGDLAIEVLPGPDFSLSLSQPGCSGGGAISVQVNSGAPPFLYLLNGGPAQSGSTFSQLPPGAYTITVRDAGGCSSTQNVQLSGGGGPQLQANIARQPSCGATDGEIRLSASGGAPPYRFALNGGNFQSSGTFSGLGPGQYTTVVRDSRDCEATTTLTLSDPGNNLPTARIEGAASRTLCLGQTLRLSGNLPAGAGGRWTSSSAGVDIRQPTQASTDIVGLQAGTISLNWTLSAPNCPSYSMATIQISIPASPDAVNDGPLEAKSPLTVSPLANDRFSGEIRLSIVKAPSKGDLDLSALPSIRYIPKTGASGADTVQYSICLVACPNQCDVATILFSLGENAPCTLGANPALVAARINGDNPLRLCPGDPIPLSANQPAGTQGRWTVSNPGSVRLDNATRAETVLTPLRSGAVTLSWTLSTAQCAGYSRATLDLDIAAPPTARNDGPVAAEPGKTTGVNPMDNDQWSGEASIRLIRQGNKGQAVVEGDRRLQYSARAGSSGLDSLRYALCREDCPELCDTATVYFDLGPALDPCLLNPEELKEVIPEGITPNGDGFNDRLSFLVVDERSCPFNYARSEVVIYNRWGDLVFQEAPYNNAWTGGNRHGGELPPGVYYYVLKIKLEKEYLKFGSVTIFR